MADNENYSGQYFLEFNTRLNDLEEKQRILKDRVLLIGNNLIETREDFRKTIIEMKKDIENLKQGFEKLKSFIETI